MRTNAGLSKWEKSRNMDVGLSGAGEIHFISSLLKTKTKTFQLNANYVLEINCSLQQPVQALSKIRTATPSLWREIHMATAIIFLNHTLSEL